MRALAIIVVALIAASSPFAQTNGVDRTAEARQYLAPCPSSTGVNSPGAWCEADQKQFLMEYSQAYAGDYHAQRNVGFCFYSSCMNSVLTNRILACAWQKVLIANGSSDDSDTAALTIACGSLSKAEERAAAERAEAILAEINAARGIR